MEKDIIRKAGIAARDNLTSDERSHFSAVICGKILESELFKSSETRFNSYPRRNERRDY